jgi:hypothetical protein
MSDPILTILRQQNETIINALSGIAEILGNQTKMLEALDDWLREPSGSDLGETLKAMTRAINEVSHNTQQIIGMVGRLRPGGSHLT